MSLQLLIFFCYFSCFWIAFSSHSAALEYEGRGDREKQKALLENSLYSKLRHFFFIGNVVFFPYSVHGRSVSCNSREMQIEKRKTKITIHVPYDVVISIIPFQFIYFYRMAVVGFFHTTLWRQINCLLKLICYIALLLLPLVRDTEIAHKLDEKRSEFEKREKNPGTTNANSVAAVLKWTLIETPYK